MRDTQNRRLLEGFAYHLQPDRQIIAGKATGKRAGRQPHQVKWHRQAQERNRGIYLQTLDANLLVHLRYRYRGHWDRRQKQHVDSLQNRPHRA